MTCREGRLLLRRSSSTGLSLWSLCLYCSVFVGHENGSSDAGARRDLLSCGRSLRPRACASLEKKRQGGQLARSANPAELGHRRVYEDEATDGGAEREAQIHEGRIEREDDRRELHADDLDQPVCCAGKNAHPDSPHAVNASKTGGSAIAGGSTCATVERPAGANASTQRLVRMTARTPSLSVALPPMIRPTPAEAPNKKSAYPTCGPRSGGAAARNEAMNE